MKNLREKIHEELVNAGVRKCSKSWDDYEVGKAVVARMPLDALEYYTAIEIVAAWVWV